MDSEIIDEFSVWKLVLDKIITYSDLKELSFIDASKLTAILDFRGACEQLEKEEQERVNNNNK